MMTSEPAAYRSTSGNLSGGHGAVSQDDRMAFAFPVLHISVPSGLATWRPIAFEEVQRVELSNEFRVPAPVEETWKILTDVEKIAPCMPGAQLLEIEGDEYRGTVKVKVGPITVEYKGVASFVELDDSAHKAVLRASGRDTRGQGNATATVTAQLSPDGDATTVSILTELDITGKVAQFGRGMLADVSTKLLGQFATRLEADVLNATGDAGGSDAEAQSALSVEPDAVAETPPADAPTGAAQDSASANTNGSSPGVRQVASTPNEPVDLMDLAGSSVAKRAIPAGVVLLVIFAALLRRRRRHTVSGK
jgi:carbon monoxide dehydrogenase subunit G